MFKRPGARRLDRIESILLATQLNLPCQVLRVDIRRLLVSPAVPPHWVDALHVKSVQHAQVERPSISLGGSEIANGFRKCGHLVVRQGIRVGGNVHAASLAKGLAPDAVAKDIVGQVLTALDGELALSGIDPDESDLVVLVKCV